MPETRTWTLRRGFRWALAVFFVLAGGNHFRVPGAYVAMIPPWIPWPRAMNAVAGLCEVAGGIGVMVPRLRVLAGWCLIGLLIAVFPANLHVALEGTMPGSSFPPALLWLRLPLQGVLVAWVGWAAIQEEPKARA